MSEQIAGPLLYAADLAGRSAGEIVRLEEDEVRHVRALRLQANDPARLTDGDGLLFEVRIVSADKRTVECRLVAPREVPPSLPVLLAFGVANKQSTMLLVEKAVEFGAVALQPLEFTRSRSVADAGRSEAFWDRARKRARSALKQSEGARMPRIEPVADLSAWLQRTETEAGTRILLDRSGVPLSDLLGDWPAGERLTVLVGPEGGCTDAEVEAAVGAGYRPAWLASSILRLETAATAALAIVAQRIGGRAL